MMSLSFLFLTFSKFHLTLERRRDKDKWKHGDWEVRAALSLFILGNSYAEGTFFIQFLVAA